MASVVLAVDIGNSAIKVATVVDGRAAMVRRLPTTEAGPVFRELVQAALARQEDGAREVPALAVVSVLPRLTAQLSTIARELGVRLLVADASTIPLPHVLVAPERTGPDRLLGAWAARESYGAPVIVVDVGTATTIDGVDGAGIFRGGAIMPGLGMAAAALARGTAVLPEIAPAPPEQALGRDTRSAMESGIVLGHLGAVRELTTRIRAELGAPAAPVVVTGGGSEAAWARVAYLEAAGPGLPPIATAIDSHLVLEGLARLAASRAMASVP